MVLVDRGGRIQWRVSEVLLRHNQSSGSVQFVGRLATRPGGGEHRPLRRVTRLAQYEEREDGTQSGDLAGSFREGRSPVLRTDAP